MTTTYTTHLTHTTPVRAIVDSASVVSIRKIPTGYVQHRLYEDATHVGGSVVLLLKYCTVAQRQRARAIVRQLQVIRSDVGVYSTSAEELQVEYPNVSREGMVKGTLVQWVCSGNTETGVVESVRGDRGQYRNILWGPERKWLCCLPVAKLTLA